MSCCISSIIPSEPSVVVDFVQNYLPVEVVELLDLTQLRIEKETFVDARLRKHFPDSLYSVPFKNRNPLTGGKTPIIQ